MKEESPLENVDPGEYLHDIEPKSPGNHATPTPPVHPRSKKELISLISQPWPSEIEPAAYHGMAKQMVDTIGPESEADPVALLVSLLAGFGNLIGDSPHFMPGADKHACKLFITLVGETSKARKGSSWGYIRNSLQKIDPTWNKNMGGGLSSGEGLIWAVRDPIEKKEPVKKKGVIVGYDTVVVDPGVDDKRLMVVEGEFAGMLNVMGRDQNPLSSVLRQAWDGDYLRTLTKNSPAESTGAHISLIGHITRDELKERLGRTDISNGFANRFLWFCVKRSKSLPEGGYVKPEDLRRLEDGLKEALEFAHKCKEVKRNNAAKKIWADEYHMLSEGRSGLLGAVTSRAEAQVMRLSCIYALLDKSRVIKPAHLSAGLALWDYSFQSCQYIFGDKSKNKDLVKLVDKLYEAWPDGLTRTSIHGLFENHRSAVEIDQLLSTLREGGIAQPSQLQTEGRPIQTWTLADGAK